MSLHCHSACISYFTDPANRPRTRYFCIAKNTANGTAIETKAAVAKISQLPPRVPISSTILVVITKVSPVASIKNTLGHDISVITHDDDLSYLKNGPDVPIFTATRSSVHKAGEMAAQMLLQQIRAPQDPPLTKMIEAELIIGQSTGPAMT